MLVASAASGAPDGPPLAPHADVAVDVAERGATSLASIRSALDELRREAITAIVEDVLADAESRPTLVGTPVTVGHDGRFFVASSDGFVRLDIGGRLQVRWVGNRRADPRGEGPRTTTGFDIARALIDLRGSIGEHVEFRISTRLQGFGRIGTQQIEATVRPGGGFAFTAGQQRLPFLRERQVSSGRTQPVERSFLAYFYGSSFSPALGLSYEGAAPVLLQAALSNGLRARETTFDGARSTTDLAVTGRIDWTVFGEHRVFADVTARGTDAPALLLGAAAHWQGATPLFFSQPIDELLQLTADASYERPGWNAMAAWTFRRIDRSIGGIREESWSLLLQGGVLIASDVEVFARYVVLVPQTAPPPNERFETFTVGATWFIAGHDLKLTGDVVLAPDPTAGTSLLGFAPAPRLGLSPTASGGQIAVRVQFQVAF